MKIIMVASSPHQNSLDRHSPEEVLIKGVHEWSPLTARMTMTPDLRSAFTSTAVKLPPVLNMVMTPVQMNSSESKFKHKNQSNISSPSVLMIVIMVTVYSCDHMVRWTLEAEHFVKVIDIRWQETVCTPAEGGFTAKFPTSVIMITVVIALFILVRNGEKIIKKYIFVLIAIFKCYNWLDSAMTKLTLMYNLSI